MRKIASPDIRPGERGYLQLELPSGWQEYDFLYVTVKDRYNQELFTWSYEIGTPDRLANRLLPQEGSTPAVKESIVRIEPQSGIYIRPIPGLIDDAEEIR